MALIALTIYSMQRLNLPLPRLVNNYVNDLLCLPLVLGAITFVIRRLKKDKLFRLPLLFVLFIVAYYSVYFEYYLPQVTARYTGDIIDVGLYFLGGIAFFLFDNKIKNGHRKTSGS